jgi:hypothetical protein
MLEELFRKAVQLGQRIAAEDNTCFRELFERARALDRVRSQARRE